MGDNEIIVKSAVTGPSFCVEPNMSDLLFQDFGAKKSMAIRKNGAFGDLQRWADDKPISNWYV